MSSKLNEFRPSLQLACAEFWNTYFTAMHDLHNTSGRTLNEPIRDRNLATTGSSHIAVFERFWRKQLALALGVSEAAVGPRTIRFREHRSKSFDVCWPLTGDPFILISVKSMQNAYRNLTNRIEEALGDLAVLRLYQCNAVFGFFFFILDGKVASGQAEQGVSLRTKGAKGVAPFLETIEEGGDFFDLSDVAQYRKASTGGERKRQDSIRKAEQSLLDLAVTEPREQGGVHYDGIAFAPTRITRTRMKSAVEAPWGITISEVDSRLDPCTFLTRLISTARLRGFIK